MTKTFYTTDVTASVRKAHAAYTHVLLNRTYSIINPVTYDSGKIADLPVRLHASWNRETFASKNNWVSAGGVLIDTGGQSSKVGRRDALIFVETPLSVKDFKNQIDGTEQEIVIYRPPSWATHEWALNIRYPSANHILNLRAHLKPDKKREAIGNVTRHAGSLLVLTDAEMVKASNITAQELLFTRKSLKSKEVWAVKLRIKPADAAWWPIWNELETLNAIDGVRLFISLTPEGWRKHLKQMARFGNISITRYHVYPEKLEWPEVLDRKRKQALEGWAAMKQYAEGLPDYFQA